MRLMLAILVFYGYAVSPWLCCCTVARAMTPVPNVKSPIDEPKKKCQSCCQERQTKPDLSKHQTKPCPIQCELMDERPIAGVEKLSPFETEFDHGFIFYRSNANQVNGQSARFGNEHRGFWLPMAELRIKIHHCMRC